MAWRGLVFTTARRRRSTRVAGPAQPTSQPRHQQLPPQTPTLTPPTPPVGDALLAVRTIPDTVTPCSRLNGRAWSGRAMLFTAGEAHTRTSPQVKTEDDTCPSWWSWYRTDSHDPDDPLGTPDSHGGDGHRHRHRVRHHHCVQKGSGGGSRSEAGTPHRPGMCGRRPHLLGP